MSATPCILATQHQPRRLLPLFVCSSWVDGVDMLILCPNDHQSIADDGCGQAPIFEWKVVPPLSAVPRIEGKKRVFIAREEHVAVDRDRLPERSRADTTDTGAKH